MKLSTLIELNKKTDAILFDYYEDEEKSNMGRNTTIGAGAFGLGAAGLYARGRAAGSAEGVIPAWRAGASALKGDIGRGYAAAAPLAQQAGAMASRVGAYGKGLYGVARQGNGVGGSIMGLLRKFKGVKFASRLDRMIELNARIDQLITFEKEPDEDDMKGKKEKKGGDYKRHWSQKKMIGKKKC